MEILLGFVILLVMFAIAFGWIGLILFGIIKLKRGQKSAGTILTVTGGIWGAIAAAVLVFIVFSVIRDMKYSNPTPFDITKYKGPTGRIVTQYKDEATLNIRDTHKNKLWTLHSSDGTFIAPAGSLEPVSYQAVKMESGRVWIASGRFAGREKAVSLGTDSAAVLNIGPPLTASIQVDKISGDKITMNLALQDAARHDFSLTGGRNDRPGFIVLDKSGKKLWQGSFEYG